MVGYSVWKRAGRVASCLCFAGVAALCSASVSAEEKQWSLDPDARIEVGAVSAQSATRDEQFIIDGDALTLRAQVGVDLEDDDTRFRVEADRIEVVRLGDGRSDTNRDRLTATFEQELTPRWEIQARLRYYDDLVTAESPDTDELQGSVAVTFEPERKHRFRVRGTWREREYDNDENPQTTGDGPRVDVQYRHRFGRYHYLTLDLRAESITSDDPRRGYERESAKISYTQPITRDLRVRPAFEVLKTRFDERMALDEELRTDTLIVPEVELLWWVDNWRVEAEAKYIFSESNLPIREREGYRFTLSVGYAF